MCVKKDWQMMYFSILLSILMGVFFSYFVSCAQAGKGFCVVMATLAAYSLAAFFALRPLADRGILAPPVFVNAYGGEFYNYLLGFTNSFCFWRCISAFTMFNGKSRPLCGCAAVFCV